MRIQLPFILLLISLCSASRAQIYDTLPVIVHVIHNGEAIGTGRNISQAQVYSQFDVLNEDYRAQNADIANVPSVFQPLVADMGLNFAKALVDPNGNTLAEPGIHRIDRNAMGWAVSPYSMSYVDGTIKPQTIWDPTQYLNIWVVDMGTAGTLSYPTFPSCSSVACAMYSPPDSLRDGIVCTYKTFGRTGNLMVPFNKGRSTTYAIAQWLGLRRLAQTTPSGGSCGDDCVADTPVEDYFSIYGCATYPATTPCNSSPDGAMFMNFMSYVNDTCKVMFTQGQKARIDSVLICGYFQSSLRLSQVPMSVKENKGSTLSFYPNPSQGTITIDVPGNEQCKAEIYSVIGNKVLEAAVDPGESLILPQQFGNGVYFIRVTAGKVNHTGRLLLAR